MYSHVVVGEFAAGALAKLVAAQVGQGQGFCALVDQFAQVGGVGGEMPTRQAGVAFIAGGHRSQQADPVRQHRSVRAASWVMW